MDEFKELFMYWIAERYRIMQKKMEGQKKPWTDDLIFQHTYFCNVRREDDKVTKWIREFYSPHVDHEMFEYNIILARFLNNIESLKGIGFVPSHDERESIRHTLKEWADCGFQIWGNAYVISTNGRKMPKVDYFTQIVLSDASRLYSSLRNACRGRQCGNACDALQRIDGVGSFLAGQFVADMKNTPGHPLSMADDKINFVVPGPGSLKGLSWLHYGRSYGVTPGMFKDHFKVARYYADEHWPPHVPVIDNQDLQNCLCEYDKYCRVRTGVGRSKRRYHGGPEYTRSLPGNTVEVESGRTGGTQP